MTVLVTGVAGFIGFTSRRRWRRAARRCWGSTISTHYSPRLKRDRIAALGDAIRFVECNFADEAMLAAATSGEPIDRIIHLGAAGVRYSLRDPRAYVRANLAGHLNIELARERHVAHLVYASSSSVYGGNTSLPFRVEDRVDHPVSLYAATKKADELMSETYAHLFRIPQTGLRFFTVYGPWGRPDMALWLFSAAILENRPIAVLNNGRMRRDFTYIDDIVAGVLAAFDRPPEDDGASEAGGTFHRMRSTISATIGRGVEYADRPDRDGLRQPGDSRPSADPAGRCFGDLR